MTAYFVVYCTGRRQSERCGTRCTNSTALHNNPGEPRQGQGRCAGGGEKDSLKLSTKRDPAGAGRRILRIQYALYRRVQERF